MSKIVQLLTDLAIDPQKQNAFLNDPNFLTNEAGLSKAEQSAVMSQESARISALFAKEQIPLAISMGDPGPDPLPDPDPFPPFPPEESEPDSD